MIVIFKRPISMEKRLMNKNHEQENMQQQLNKPRQKRSKKKLILMGSIFVACAFLLKRDAH